MKLKNFTLELSSKPFKDNSETTMYSVCKTMFWQWKDMTDQADIVSVMLWISDGSEIFEYTGNLDQTFEWAYWIGFANHPPVPENPTPREYLSMFKYPKKYIPNPQPKTYGWLKRLIEVIRETGAQITGKPIRIGATFDNGPEFAVAPFKYKKHLEITRNTIDFNVVICNSTLHADPQPYAAFPQGIPEGTTLGHFMGKQFNAFAKDMGYDYLWLSNGMGFGTEPWSVYGALFDEKKFFPEKADKAKETMLKFWEDLYAANPNLVVETRGSNYSAGLELASEAAPLKELYRNFKIAPPINSPWAAINFNTGLEIAAWMSHVAELPDDRFPFRFYVHDPWFINSPWLDRYGREPWDIYLPMSIGRIDEGGKVTTPNSISILSVDDTEGQLPPNVPREVITHLQEAFDKAPDAPGPLIWIYPFSEYCDHSTSRQPRLEDIYAEDFFLGETIQHGLPLNTVVSTENFARLIDAKPNLFQQKIILVPVFALETNFRQIKKLLDCKANLLVYGTLNRTTQEVKELLGLTCDSTPITGTVTVETTLPEDVFQENGFARTAEIYGPFDGGGLTEVPAPNASVIVCATATQNGKARVLASLRQCDNGSQVVFLRSVMPCKKKMDTDSGWFSYAATEEAFPVPVLARWIIGAYFGWTFHYEAFTGASQQHCSHEFTNSVMPRPHVARHDGAFFYNIYARNTAVDIYTKSPLGAPLLTEMETRIKDGCALWHPGKAWHKECRCFVKQQQDSVISAKYQTRNYIECHDRRNYAGFRDAEVRFFVPTGYEGKLVIEHSDVSLKEIADEVLTPQWEHTPYGICAVVKHVNGYLSYTW